MERFAYSSFADPFYLEEHKNPVSRVLHVFGTTLVLWMAFTEYHHQLPNLFIAFSIGAMLCEFLSPLSNGLIEFASIFLIAGALAYCRGQKYPWKLAVIGYFFAWVGHFFFEHNRPATFVYPSYSLICDLIMWFQTVTGRLPLTETL